MFTAAELEISNDVHALKDVARELEGDPYLAGVWAGLSGALPSMLQGNSTPAPTVVAVPMQWAGSTDGRTWSAEAREYARGFDAGWAAVIAEDVHEGLSDGDVVLTFGRVLADTDVLISATDAFDYAAWPSKWRWNFGVWDALGRPVDGAAFRLYAEFADLAENHRRS